jgi:hypothetical protein
MFQGAIFRESKVQDICKYEKNNLSILLMKCELYNPFYEHSTKYVMLVLANLCTLDSLKMAPWH